MSSWGLLKLYAANLGMLITFIYLASLVHKWWLPKLWPAYKRLLFGVTAVAAGWVSMVYGFPMGHGAFADLRFLPLIVAPMFLLRSWTLIPIGIGIGVGRFWFGWSEAALIGFLNLTLMGCLAALLHAWTRDSSRWTMSRRMTLFIVALNLFNTAFSALFGVLGPVGYFRSGGGWVFAASVVLSACFVLLLRDLQRDYARRTALMEEASRDFLTKLYNVRTFERIFPGLMDRMEKEGRPVSVAFLDIDFFKKVNDTYGHSTGDAVLRRIGELMGRLTRWNDFVGRYGGEEFIMVLPDCLEDEAVRVLERVRVHVQELPLRVGGKTIRITLSAGIASYPKVERDRLVEAADEALYEAKRTGRNRVCVYTGGSCGQVGE